MANRPYDSPYVQQKTISKRLTVEAGTDVPKRVKQSDGTTPCVGLGPIEQSTSGWVASEKRKLSKGK